MTPNREQLLALAERVEQSKGPDRGLDADIELAVGNWTEHHHEAWHRFQECSEAVNPPISQPVDPQWFTTSLDAAMTLPSENPSTALHEAWRRLSLQFALHMRRWPDDEKYSEWMARFVTSASLRAIAEGSANG